MRSKGSPSELEKRRQRAIVLVLEHDYTSAEAAEAVGVEPRSVQRWLAAYREKGRKGIVATPAPGRPSLLDDRDIAKLESILLKGPVSAGYDNDLWTCRRIGEVIEKTFQVSFHRSHIWRLLQQIGWSPQKPERRAIERDESGIRRFIKTEWKKIVKNVRKQRPP
jgi:transposase